MTHLLSILQRPNVVILLGGTLLFDLLAVAGAFKTHGCMISTSIPVIQTSSGLAVANDDSTSEQVVGQIRYSVYRGPRIMGPWAGTQRVFDPSFTYLPAGGAAPTPAELAQTRVIYANVVASQFIEPEFAAAVRTSSPPVRTPFISGYVHNAVSLAIAAAFLCALPCSLAAAYRADRAARRLSCGQCPACGYDLTTLAPETLCPECGTRR